MHYISEETAVRKNPFSIPRYYFITYCTLNRQCTFGTISMEGGENSTWKPTEYGRAAAAAIESLKRVDRAISIEHYVVMPNHIHMLLCCNKGNEESILKFVNKCRKHVTHQLTRIRPKKKLWCPLSYDMQIIRNKTTHGIISNVIREHRKNWQYDTLYMPDTAP